MNAYSTYTIRFDGDPEAIKKVYPVIDAKLPDYLDFDFDDVVEVIEIEEENYLVYVENITNDLAVNMAKAAPDLIFTIEGVVDTSESAGEYMDFAISYNDGKIIEKTSRWYLKLYVDEFEDYEEFCEEYCDDDGEPTYTEEEYERFNEHGDAYVLEGGDEPTVLTVPLEYTRTIEV